MKIIDVAVGIILDSSKSKVLVAQRNTDDEHYGQWEFPGGKIAAGESANAALNRELDEELNLQVIASQPFEALFFKYSRQSVNLNFFLVTEYSGKPKGNQGQIIKWVNIKNLHELEMLKANKNIIAELQSISL